MTAPSPAELWWRIRWLAGPAVPPPPEHEPEPGPAWPPTLADLYAEIVQVRPAHPPAVEVEGWPRCWIQYHLTVMCTSGRVDKTVESGNVSPADAYNDRIDALDLRVETDRAGRLWPEVVYMHGTPAPAPAQPCLTFGAVRLATIDVPAGGTPPSVRSTIDAPEPGPVPAWLQAPILAELNPAPPAQIGRLRASSFRYIAEPMSCAECERQRQHAA